MGGHAGRAQWCGRGSSIAIYDGDKKIGSVTVTMPLDVISYAGAAIGSKICP